MFCFYFLYFFTVFSKWLDNKLGIISLFFVPLFFGLITYWLLNGNWKEKILYFIFIPAIPSIIYYFSYPSFARDHNGHHYLLQIKIFVLIYIIGFFLSAILGNISIKIKQKFLKKF